MRDYGAIVHSSKFRRLAHKTQVYLNSQIDYPRTRLPHSIEASQIARQLSRAFCKAISTTSKGRYNRENDWHCFDRDFEDLVTAATLAHDLGQPPFGHKGDVVLADLTLQTSTPFEANKQNVRLLLGSEARASMEVSSALVDAVIKYKDIDCFPLEKRPGFYKSEEDKVKSILERTGTGLNKRHPACFLMEAADDIAYIAADIEDSLKLGLLTSSHFTKHLKFLPILDDKYQKVHSNWKDELKQSPEVVSSRILKALIAYAIKGLQKAINGANLPDVINRMNDFAGCHSIDNMNLLYWQNAGSSFGKEIKDLKEQLYKKGVLQKSAVAEAEHLAQKVVSELFLSLMPIIQVDYKKQAVFNLVPDHVQKIVIKLHDNKENHTKGRQLIADYISGMTDRFALELWERLHQPARLRFVG